MIDTTRQAQENLTKSHYPEILWTGSSGHGFSKPKYKRGWKPDPNVPPRLNSLEAAEYAEGYSSKYYRPAHDEQQTNLRQGRTDRNQQRNVHWSNITGKSF